MFFPEKNTTSDVHPETEKLYHAFVSSNSNNEKCVILSFVPNSYSKTEIMKLFNCSRYLLDKAKKASYFQQINQSNFTKPKLDCEKTQHFIEFLFSSGAIQEVAYGTTILKFNELESQRIPKVLTVMKSQIICMYKQYCESLTYKHLPESYLYIMLSELKLNQRKASSGLDNITATGLSAINDMTELVKNDQLL